MTFPGRPSADPDDSYAPMARRPERLECGSPAHSGHLSPPCCLVGWMLYESRMEVEEYLHMQAMPGHHSAAVPTRVEPIPPPAILVDGHYVPALEGRKQMVTDSGALGGPPWSSPMHRRMDISVFEGETVQATDRMRVFDKAVSGLRRYCAGHHSSWVEHRGRPVCWELVRTITHSRADVATAALQVELTPERAAYLLHRFADKRWVGAADKVWTWVANDLNGIVGLRRRKEPAA